MAFTDCLKIVELNASPETNGLCEKEYQMTWKPTYRYPLYPFADTQTALHPMRLNEQCFIRKEHRCGKIFGASKSCFVACPTDENLEPILGLLSEKLSKVGVEPIIAVKERAYGQDIFCTKICGKIIEARFCLVILDDALIQDTNIPNPNVYYEYGLMTSLRKHIIPLQKAELELAFNIQSYDTIKYNPGNINSELDRAIKDAIRITESPQKEQLTQDLPDKTILRRFELAGFDLKDAHWFLSHVIDDTLFYGFGHTDRRHYLYLGKIDESDDFQNYLEDLDVILFRTEKEARALSEKLREAKDRRASLIAQEQQEEHMEVIARRTRRPFVQRELQEVESDINDLTSKEELMATVYIGFIINDRLDCSEFIGKTRAIVDQYERYKVSFNSGTQITFGETQVTLERPSL
jgi:hypothetical protein